jgi:alkylmercury lyase
VVRDQRKNGGRKMTTTLTTETLVDHVWQRFQDVGFTPDFGLDGSRLLIALYRRLAAEPRPISIDEVADIAAGLGIAREVAAELVAGMSERDEAGAVRGIVGLSLNDHPHRFRVGDRELTNWCALDPLLVVPTMTEDVELESPDPQTGDAVRVLVSPERVKTQVPEQAMMSIVVPEPGATESVEAVWMLFCHQVHFFTSREAGEAFFANKPFEVYFLTLDEAFELGRLMFAPLYEQLSA